MDFQREFLPIFKIKIIKIFILRKKSLFPQKSNSEDKEATLTKIQYKNIVTQNCCSW